MISGADLSFDKAIVLRIKEFECCVALFSEFRLMPQRINQIGPCQFWSDDQVAVRVARMAWHRATVIEAIFFIDFCLVATPGGEAAGGCPCKVESNEKGSLSQRHILMEVASPDRNRRHIVPVIFALASMNFDHVFNVTTAIEPTISISFRLKVYV